jgi:hypothetical protein
MQPLRDDTFHALCSLMHEAIGVHFTPAKMTLVASRLGPRIQKLGLGGYDDYLGLISGAGRNDGATGGEFQMAVAGHSQQSVPLHPRHRLAHGRSALFQALRDTRAQRNHALLLEVVDRPQIHLGGVNQLAHMVNLPRMRSTGNYD